MWTSWVHRFLKVRISIYVHFQYLGRARSSVADKMLLGLKIQINRVIILICMEIQPVHPKGNQSWMFIGRTDVEAETPIFWPPDLKSWLVWKDPDAGKDWGQEEKGMTGDEMVGWHHWRDGQELEKAPGVGDGQGSLACCSPWGRKESDTTERLNWTEFI